MMFPLLFLSLLFPPSLPIQCFCSFLNMFHRAAASLADGLSCVLPWVHWSRLGMGQPLVSSHRGHPAALCCQHLATYSQRYTLLTWEVMK